MSMLEEEMRQPAPGPVRVITKTESWATAVQSDVVERLREVLAMAESGEIQGFAYSALCVDGQVATGYTKTSDHSAIIGGLSIVQHRMIAGRGTV